MQLTEDQKIQITHRIFEEDIECYGQYFFPHYMKLETPMFHKEIYQLFQSDEKKLGIGAPRGHAKSTVTDLVYLSWEIVNRRKKFVLLVSDTYSQVVLFLEALKAEFEANDKLKTFYGNLKTDKWSEGEIVVGDTMVRAVGAGMKVRGLRYRDMRPDLIIIDDLENDELVQNKERRAKLERWFNGALVPSMDKSGRIVVIGTILHYDSLLAKILDHEQYPEYETRLYKAINDYGALWEQHLDMRELNKLKEEYTKKGQSFLFYQEYQNDPVSDENRKFKIEKIKYYEEEKIQEKTLRTYITFDRAYSLQKTADFTGILVVSVDLENNWYVRLAERFKDTEEKLIEKIFDLKNYYKPIRIGIEQKAFQYTLKPTLDNEMRRRNVFFTVEELREQAQSKNMRIEGLIPRFENGSIYFKRDQTDVIDELIMFPVAVHDDLADALAYQLQIQLPVSMKTKTNDMPQKKKTKKYNSMRMA